MFVKNNFNEFWGDAIPLLMDGVISYSDLNSMSIEDFHMINEAHSIYVKKLQQKNSNL